MHTTVPSETEESLELAQSSTAAGCWLPWQGWYAPYHLCANLFYWSASLGCERWAVCVQCALPAPPCPNPCRVIMILIRWFWIGRQRRRPVCRLYCRIWTLSNLSEVSFTEGGTRFAPLLWLGPSSLNLISTYNVAIADAAFWRKDRLFLRHHCRGI